MTNIKIGTQDFQVKSCFDECTIDEISHIMVSQNMILGQGIDATETTRLKVGIFLRLSNVPAELFLKLTRLQQLNLFNTVRWAFQGRVENKPFEFFDVNGVRFYLPDLNYSNTSAIEMALLNIYYLSFVRKTNPVKDNLYLIVATICRPERRDLKTFERLADKWTGDKREVYNSVFSEERAKLFKEKAPFGILIAILQYWEAMNNRFIKRFDDVFNGGEGKQIFQNGEGWLAMLADVAEVGVMGNLEKVYEANAFSLMMWVLQKQKKVERLEEIRAAQESQ
jgi:hypothetical protein